MWALLALAFAQFAIAGHSAVHADHAFEIAHAQQQISHDHNSGHGDSDAPRPHECPECLLVKSLQTAFHASDVGVADFALPAETVSSTKTPYISQAVSSPYSPRAPPAFLI